MLRWTLEDNQCECAGLRDWGRFVTTVEGRKISVIIDRNPFQHYTAWRAWKRQWVVLSRHYLRVLIDTHFVNKLFVWCEQELSYCRRLRYAYDVKMEVAEADPGLRCRFLDMPYTNLCPMHNVSTEQGWWSSRFVKKSGRDISLFVSWHSLEMFVVRPKEWYSHYVSKPALWRSGEAIHMLCVPTPLISTYCTSAFGNNAQQFGFLLRKTANTEFTFLSCSALFGRLSKAWPIWPCQPPTVVDWRWLFV